MASPNPLTVVSNDPTAARKTGAGRHEMKEFSGGNNNEMKAFFDDVGLVFLIGRGDTDENITYRASYNTNGVLCYTYPDAAGTGLITQTTKP